MSDEAVFTNWLDRVDQDGALPLQRDRIPDWMGPDEFLAGARRAADRLVLVTVGRWDARARRALDVARAMPARCHRAVHVATEPVHARVLASAWSNAGVDVPLAFVENDGGVAATIARVVEMEIAAGYDEVVVIAGQRVLQSPLEWLVRDRTARSIERAVEPIPAALTGLVAVPAR